ncbi:unnamed protein product [Toxocara canis]|uniref:Metalloendopeptidase n=1 Tax=Toxocara canis TaxID=6265 RepID=A0A183UTH8_TOXCA|nr:unnamed protein product [Toxocara canis]
MEITHTTVVVLTITGMVSALSETLKSSWQINTLLNADVRFGDLLVSPRQLRKYLGAEEKPKFVARKDIYDTRWQNNVVPFQLSNQYDMADVGISSKVKVSLTRTLLNLTISFSRKAFIVEALHELQRRSCFIFVKRTTQADYISIEPLDGCYSYVGRIGGRQVMSLASDCLARHIIWHEMMHAIGFEHEHQRPDRDAYIRVEYNNVIPGQIVNFEKLKANEVDLYDDIYDYHSIMHYDGTAFGQYDRKAMKRLATMIPLKRGIQLNENTDFTRLDIEKLNQLGKCTKRSDKPYQGSNCDDTDSNCSKLVSEGLCEHLLYK